MRLSIKVAGAACLLSQAASAITVTATDASSLKSAASTVAYGLMKYYTGNNTGDVPGNLPDPYYWWEAGAMFGTMIDYWFFTGDSTYNNVTKQAILHQVGTDKDFMPTNQTRTEGNDDQGFWALAAMTAAEDKFPDPPSGEAQWLALVQAVFNEYTTRWDTAVCGGGLRWQIFTFNNGYNYKNSISNGCFFNIAARLARYTGNSTYSDWAAKVFEWEYGVGLVSTEGAVFDGAGINENNTDCKTHDQIQWSYNAGIYLHGAAVMYNVTNGNSTWKSRVDTIWNETATVFFNNSVMIEQYCEASVLCDTDQQSFKGYLTRWMGGTVQMAPYMADTIMPYLRKDAEAAGLACTGSPSSGFSGIAGTACGFKWTTGAFDGLVGVGEQMNALSAMQYALVLENTTATTPATSSSGGTSQGNVNAGASTSSKIEVKAITTGGRVAAGFLTTAIVCSIIGGSVFVMQ